MLEAATYYLLKKHFRGEGYYVDVMELFWETTFQTEMGQLTNLITAPEDEVDLSKFPLKKCVLCSVGSRARIDRSMKTFTYLDLQNRIVLLPVALAMYMSHVPQSYASGT